MPNRILSIIVPAFNCSTIKEDLTSLDHLLKRKKLFYEVICVVDGLKSSKDKTLEKAQSLKLKKLTVVTYERNHGKGYAVRFGMRLAKGSVIGFFDAGSDIDLQSLSTAIDLFYANNPDMIIGSKKHKNSDIHRQPLVRKSLTFLARIVAKTTLNLPVSDTQVGMKLFSRKLITQVLPLLTIDGFAFDLELLALAHKLGFKNIIEVPVTVSYNRQSTIRLSSLLKFATEYLRIIYRTRLA